MCRRLRGATWPSFAPALIYLLVGAKPCRIAAARGSQIALSQRVDGKEEISFADLAFFFERTLTGDYVDFAELSEREAV